MKTDEATETTVWDAIVIGGGPAGSITGLSLARRGRKVLILEKSEFPRFHIGESFLPATFDQLKQLGLEPSLRALPHTCKYGAEFAMGQGGTHLFIDFADGYCNGKEAFNIERAPFDAMLLTEAAKAGAEVRNSVTVKQILNLTDGDVCLQTDAGEMRCRYLLDASGQSTVVGRHLKSRKQTDDPNLKKVAYGSHFEKVTMPSGRQAGYPFIVMTEEGWFWMIPITYERVSVGMVMDAEIAKRVMAEEKIPPDRMLAWGIARCPAVRDRMRNAVGAETNQVAADFTYTCRPYAGPGYFMVGDSATFLDPIFSTGVFVAVNGAIESAGLVDDILAGRTSPAKARKKYIARIEACTGALSHLIRHYYNHSFRELFMQGTGPVKIHKAMIGVLAGNVYPRVPWKVRWRLRLFDHLVKLNRKRQLVPRRRRFSLLKCDAILARETGASHPEETPAAVGEN